VCVKVGMKRLGMVKENAHIRDKRRGLTTGNRPTRSQCSNNGVILYELHSCNLKL